MSLRQGLQLLGARTPWAAQQCSSLSSLSLAGWWQAASSSAAAAAPAAQLGWQRVAALVPSLRDVLAPQWLAAPKKKVGLSRCFAL